MSNPIPTTTARLFFGHIFKESNDGRLSTTEDCETACRLYSDFDLNDVDEDGDTVLHVAAACGNVNLINTIFQKAKGLLDKPNREGITPFRRAIQSCKLKAAEALLQCGASVDGLTREDLLCEDEFEYTVLDRAAKETNAFFINAISRFAKGLLDLPNRRGRTPLSHAIELDRVEAAEALIDAGASTTVLAKGDISYWKSRLPSEHPFFKNARCLPIRINLLALAIHRAGNFFLEKPISSNSVELLLQYNDSWDDSDTLAKQIFSYGGYSDKDCLIKISKGCSEIIKEAEDSIAEKRAPFIQLLSEFMATDTAGLVVQYTYIK